MRNEHPSAGMITATALALLLWSCAKNDPQDVRDTLADRLDRIQDEMPGAGQEVDMHQEWVVERNAILADLRALRKGLDERLGRHMEELTNMALGAADRRKHDAVRMELEKEKEIVEGLIKNVEGATDATWETVKVDTRSRSQEVKEWWARKENTDRKTDADNDNDGH